MMAELAQILPKLKETPRRHMTDEDLLHVAVKVARTGCSESEACVSMGIRPDTYFVFKSRAKRDVRYSNIRIRAREMMIDGLITSMESVGSKDWRMYNERLIHIAPDRFSDKQSQASPTQVNVSITLSAAQDMYKKLDQAKTSQVIDAKVVPQLTDAQPKTD